MPLQTNSTPITAELAPGILLDARRALIHQEQKWMALADLHFGYEVHRSRKGAILPHWGMEQCRETLLALLNDHQPQKLILVGDIMDGSFSATETGKFIDQLNQHVQEIILIEGNHDRPSLRRHWRFITGHHEGEFMFVHGHQGITPPSVYPTSGDRPPTIIITGHEHPAIALHDRAGLNLKLPALIQRQLSETQQNWILPAFSPWAAGGHFRPAQNFLAAWVCTPKRVWQSPRSHLIA